MRRARLIILTLIAFMSWQLAVTAISAQGDTVSTARSLPESWPSLNEIQASAWIVYDRSTGKVILEKNADTILYPASTTKIMTALLVLENLPLEQMVTASEMAVKLGSASSKVGLVAGEIVMVRDLVAGMMVASGNDAANVFAETMDGSNEAFALRMNEKAAELGLVKTHFCNPSGLHDDAHVSTARELAMLADHAMKNDQFHAIVSLKSYVMPATNSHPYLGWALLTNSNKLLSFDETFRSEYVTRYTGIKTGTTGLAGNCLIAAAELVDGRELISVLLGVPGTAIGNIYNSTRTLIDAAAQIVLQDYVPAQTETTGSSTVPPATPTPSLSASPATTTTSGQLTDSTTTTSESGQPETGGLSGFIMAEPWRMAFILLSLFLIALYVRGAFQVKKRRKKRPDNTMPDRTRRNDRP